MRRCFESLGFNMEEAGVIRFSHLFDLMLLCRVGFGHPCMGLAAEATSAFAVVNGLYFRTPALTRAP